MLLVSTSFIINTNIFSLFLFIVFHLIKGHTAIFNNLHFYTWEKKKKKLYKETDVINWTKVHWHFFVFVFCFGYVQIFHRNYICLKLSNLYQILRIQYKDTKLGGPQNISFCVCVNCYDPTCMCILRGCNSVSAREGEIFLDPAIITLKKKKTL